MAGEIVESQVGATVVRAEPLWVLIDGATQPCPAMQLDDAPAFIEGHRVVVAVRNPLVPLVLGIGV